MKIIELNGNLFWKVLAAFIILSSHLSYGQSPAITSDEFTDSTISLKLKNEFNNIKIKIYNGVIEGKIRAYQNDSLTTSYTKNEAKYLESFEKKVYVKKGSSKLYSPMDTIIKSIVLNNNQCDIAILISKLYPSEKQILLAKTDSGNCYLPDTNYTGALAWYIDNNYKDTLVPQFYNPKYIAGISCYYNQKNDFKDMSRKFDLTYISLDNPTDHCYRHYKELFYIKFNDLSIVLSIKEIEFILTFSNIFFNDQKNQSIIDGFSYNEEYDITSMNMNTKWSKLYSNSINLASTKLVSDIYQFYSESNFKNKQIFKDVKFELPVDNETYYNALYDWKTTTFFPDPNDPYYTIDSIYPVRNYNYQESKLIFTKDAIGLTTRLSELTNIDKTIFIKRTDFYNICDPWIAYLLKEYF